MNRTISSDSKQLQSGKLTTNAVHWEPVLAVMSNRGRCSHPKCKRNRVLCAGCCFSCPSGSRSWAELRAVQVQHQQRESDAHLRLLKVVFAYLAHVESPCFVNAEVKQTSCFHCLQHQTCSPPLLFLPLQAFFFQCCFIPSVLRLLPELNCCVWVLLCSQLLFRAVPSSWAEPSHALFQLLSVNAVQLGSDEQAVTCGISSQAKQEATIWRNQVLQEPKFDLPP